jgi:glucose/arabinose dehydrogenase
MFKWLLIILAVTRVCAVEVPDGFVVETLATNLNALTALTVAPDGRIFIADQTGPLRVWKNGRVLPRPALDLSDRVEDYWERGLIGVTLHPDFPRTPHLFVVYVAKKPFTHHVVSRFTMIGDQADAASELILLEGDDQKTLGGTIPHGHQGGPICFGSDGKLYVSIGEQTAGQPAQSLNTLQGKILRLNADGSIPPDNPFFSQTAGKYRAIWAYGVRNSFGLAVQPGTSRMFFTDVGGSAFEEVNELLRGANYGWPQAEGFSTNGGFKNPLYAYPPAIGRSIVGAAFWQGKVFFADWAANWLKALDLDTTNVSTFAKGLDAPATIESAPDGSLLVLNRGTLWRDGKKWRPNTGSLLRIRKTGGTQLVVRKPEFPRTLPAMDLKDLVEVSANVLPWRPGVSTRTWHSPEKTMVIQQHSVEKTGKPFETHLIWFDEEESRIVRAAAYRWNSDGNSAALIEDGEIITLPGDPAHRWFSPGTEEHLNLDTAIVGFLLPLGPQETNGSLEDRVRSYLDVNCAVCHQPGGPSRGNFDLRFGGPLNINAELVAGDLGIAGARLVVPGEPDKSILLQRVIRHDTFRMPPTALNDDPQPVVPLLREWIESMKK